MTELDLEPCPDCQSLGAQRAGWSELLKHRVVTMIVCRTCGNTRMNLASFYPLYDFVPFNVAESMARTAQGQRW